MLVEPILVFHICAGFIGLLAGAAAITLRKGSRWHRKIGNIFVISMVCMASSGAYVGYQRNQPSNILAGLFTVYLVATAWMAGRRRQRQTSAFDWTALALGVIVTAGFLTVSIRTILAHDDGAAVYLVFGIVALLALVGDVRMLHAGGIIGRARIARHLWRMCIPLFIAVNALFLARAHLFPVLLQRTHLVFAPSLATLGAMIFWMIRIRSNKPLRSTPDRSGAATHVHQST